MLTEEVTVIQIRCFKDKEAWLAGEYEWIEDFHSEAAARVAAHTYCKNGGFLVERHKIETTTIALWRD